MAERAEYDYVIAGAGSAGCVLAYRLTEDPTIRVLLLEAGGRDTHPLIHVPIGLGRMWEHRMLDWGYDTEPEPRLDGRRIETMRGKVLGGSSSINVMAYVRGHPGDYDRWARNGCRGWSYADVLPYFKRCETWERGENAWRGGDGPLSVIDSRNRDPLFDAWLAAAREADWPYTEDYNGKQPEGFGHSQWTIRNGRRCSAAAAFLRPALGRPNLTVETHALATRVLLDGNRRAVGVEYQQGERLYRAHPAASATDGLTRQARARREVILAGGAFNTPQLLMLSGIGPRDALGEHDIPVLVPLAGVGGNLQDRYEVAVVYRMKKPWEALDGATFSTSDPQYREWRDTRAGVYSTNGAVASVIARSTAAAFQPDLFCYAIIGDFRGYEPTYSKRFPEHLDRLTWVVLKGHTNNRGGTVRLASRDPRATPAINFRYFDEGTGDSAQDLDAVVHGIRLVRRMTEGLQRQFGAVEDFPGPAVDTDDELRTFARDHAWGHHASCTCPIGPESSGGVLGSDFTVHGTQGLRVVDASVFPRIPGLFIVSAIYMVGEKAADVIIDAAKRS